MFRNIPDLPLSAGASLSTRSRVSQMGGTEIRFEGSVYDELAGIRVHGPHPKSSKRPKYQWLDFAQVSPFFHC
jgi:hypothetical protein